MLGSDGLWILLPSIPMPVKICATSTRVVPETSLFHAISTDGCGLVNGPIIAWIVNPSASMESSDPDPDISLYPAIAFENTAQFLLRCLKGAHPTECSSSISCIFGGSKSTCNATPDPVPSVRRMIPVGEM